MHKAASANPRPLKLFSATLQLLLEIDNSEKSLDLFEKNQQIL
jgi:hypothetical protein